MSSKKIEDGGDSDTTMSDTNNIKYSLINCINIVLYLWRNVTKKMKRLK